MAAARSSTTLVPVQPTFTDAERLALAGYLAGHPRSDARGLHPRPQAVRRWCQAQSMPLFSVRRADIETFARELEARGRARATVTRRLSTISGFYKYAVEEELLDHSPAAHVRRPRVDYESDATALDRTEVGALLVAAGLGAAAEHALISLLALNGLRVSEATGVDIEHLRLERGHRTLVVTRKGGKVVTVPLAPRTARAIDLAIGERTGDRCSWRRTGSDSTGTARPASCAGSPTGPGSPKRSARTRCGTRLSPPHLTPESRCETCRKPHRTPTRAPPCAMTGPVLASTATPLTSSLPTSLEQPGYPGNWSGRRPRPDQPLPRTSSTWSPDLAAPSENRRSGRQPRWRDG